MHFEYNGNVPNEGILTRRAAEYDETPPPREVLLARHHHHDDDDHGHFCLSPFFKRKCTKARVLAFSVTAFGSDVISRPCALCGCKSKS
jgi:hypothetical protein